MGYDQVGSLRAVADSLGDLVKVREYDSFGSLLYETNPAMPHPFGFAGGFHDMHTGLVHFGHRDYLPEVGRWTAKDPIGYAGGDVDLYGYCLDDPINGIDPLGLFRFRKRPLENAPFLRVFAGKYLDEHNLEGMHEHGFYEDGSGDHVGFGKEGVIDVENRGKYVNLHDNPRYDD